MMQTFWANNISLGITLIITDWEWIKGHILINNEEVD
jgi:hypothetical protein